MGPIMICTGAFYKCFRTNYILGRLIRNRLTLLSLILVISMSSVPSVSTTSSVPGSTYRHEFYRGCETVDNDVRKNSSIKLCGGIGIRNATQPSCIKTKDCIFASSISENTTHFIVASYKNLSFVPSPCTVPSTFFSNAFLTSEWSSRNEAWINRIQCKEVLTVKDIIPFLYVNSSMCKKKTGKTDNHLPIHEVHGTMGEIGGWKKLDGEATCTRTIDKQGIFTHCLDLARNISEMNTVFLYLNGLPGILMDCGEMPPKCHSTTGLNERSNSTGKDIPETNPELREGTPFPPENMSWQQGFKGIKKYDGIFYTNLDSGKQLLCTTAAEVGSRKEHIRWGRLALPIVVLFIFILLLLGLICKRKNRGEDPIPTTKTSDDNDDEDINQTNDNNCVGLSITNSSSESTDHQVEISADTAEPPSIINSPSGETHVSNNSNSHTSK